MKDYFIRAIFGMLTYGIVSGIACIYNIEMLQFGKPVSNFILVIIVISGGWGGWYLYKASKKEKQ